MRSYLVSALLCIMAFSANAQVVNSDVLGVHNMGPYGQSPTVGSLPPCLFCHAPHNSTVKAATSGIWSQKLSTVQNYTLYSSSTMTNAVQQPTLGRSSNLCLSCHDGTVAPGQSSPYGQVKMSGSMNSQDVFGQDLSTVHPFNFTLKNGYLQPAPSLISTLTQQHPVTGNPAVKLIDGNVQCESCHNAHVQGIDSSNMFLVVDNSGSALCQACHTSTPTNPVAMSSKKISTSVTKTTNTQSGTAAQSSYSGLTVWANSAHAQSGYQASKTANVGPYGTVRKNGCLSCHSTHKAQGGGALLAPAKQATPNVDIASQTCLNCHNGGSTISPAITNIYAEFSKKGHPLPNGSNQHTMNESTILDKNRHATCVDCHEPHATQKTTSFTTVSIRPSQSGAQGVSAVDGVTTVNPAVNQYEVCLRCHGSSSGKQILTVYGYLPTRLLNAGDPLNLVPMFGTTAGSSHPVMHDRSSTFSQPSLLKFMWNLDGHTQGRTMGTRLLCTDCHNSDDNREFGGTGPSGPHGSQFAHILERRYEFSQVASGVAPLGGPGSAIQNLLPPIIDPTANGPYSLCAKCHDLSNIMSNASFSKHSTHISAGFSCSVCHTSHGVPQGSASPGVRLVNFDIGVVAQNDSQNVPIAYNQASGTCTLKCHNYNHNQNGTVTLSQGKSAVRVNKQ